MTKKIVFNERYQQTNFYAEKAFKDQITINKKKFYDLSFCSGVLILGHNNKILQETLKEFNNKKISIFAHPNIYAEKLAKLIKKFFPRFSNIVFCNSGTESVIKALRICKSINNKKYIVSVSGSWHGSVDQTLYSPGKNLEPIPISAGLDFDQQRNLKFIPYNDIKKSEKIIKKFKNSINCIIIEPIQGCLPTKKAKQYLIFLRKITKKYKINLIFDEMITGLRTEGTSLQSYFKIYPDISVFGKCFGGGLPMGIIGISKKIDDQIKRGNKKIFFGGTFSGNSIATYVGMKTTKFILKNKKSIFSKLEKNSDFFQKELNNFFLDKKIKAKVYRFKSMLRIVYSNKDITNRIQRDFLEKKNIKKIEKLRKFLLKRNIYYPTSGVIFFSTATSKNDIIKLIKSFKIGCQKFLR